MVTVAITFRNEAKYIGECIKAILGQTHNDFELILLNDASTDNSEDMAKAFKDPRIRYLKNNINLGIAKSRNICLDSAKGDYIFFTDADCVVAKDWLAEGLRYLKKGCLGVEGKTLAISDEHTILHKVVANLHGNQWMTCNMAYSTDAIKKLNGFDEKFYNMMEDRDLALRVLKNGSIFFNKNMLVHHHLKKLTFKMQADTFKGMGKARVYLYKKYRDKNRYPFFIIYPTHLLTVIFPPLLLYKIYRDKLRNAQDVKILFYAYIGYIIERYWMWKTALKEKIFLI